MNQWNKSIKRKWGERTDAGSLIIQVKPPQLVKPCHSTKTNWLPPPGWHLLTVMGLCTVCNWYGRGWVLGVPCEYLRCYAGPKFDSLIISTFGMGKHTHTHTRKVYYCTDCKDIKSDCVPEESNILHRRGYKPRCPGHDNVSSHSFHTTASTTMATQRPSCVSHVELRLVFLYLTGKPEPTACCAFARHSTNWDWIILRFAL